MAKKASQTIVRSRFISSSVEGLGLFSEFRGLRPFGAALWKEGHSTR